MKTESVLSNSTQKIPLVSAVLLVLAALLFIAALKLLNGGQTPHRAPADFRTTYQAHRHHAVSVDGNHGRGLIPNANAPGSEEVWN